MASILDYTRNKLILFVAEMQKHEAARLELEQVQKIQREAVERYREEIRARFERQLREEAQEARQCQRQPSVAEIRDALNRQQQTDDNIPNPNGSNCLIL